MRLGAPDAALTRFSGLAAVTELIDRLGIIDKLDAAVGPIKDRDRGCSAGQMLVGMSAAQLCGEDFLVGLDRHRADTAGQALTPVPGLASTTAAGLARKFIEGQWAAVETGLGDVHTTALDLLAQVKSAGVVCDDDRVIFLFGQALSAGMVVVEVASSALVAVSGILVTRERARTSRPR
ncbi:hypothetical protein [Pseudonocardia sp. HH130629-09]|uniref:hypothetical protein n=1 Tax=Pseudonocardia sp. HH130629-09 TaxID=1641402 RepID=UPI0011AE7185|nr:hypothetical protein [Pseudonocardia sp. HH130629-09]